MLEKIYWCSRGFQPNDVAEGKCENFNKNQFGCSDCGGWKLMLWDEIRKQKSQFKENGDSQSMEETTNAE